jgi:hypothetical protein
MGNPHLTGQFQVPLDHPYLARFEDAHSVDHDHESTGIAIRLVNDALAGGHPDDKDAARKVLAGPAGARDVQGGLQRYFETAAEHDQDAELHSTDAVRSATAALKLAEERRDLPGQSVLLADGASRTRGQVQAGHDERLVATAYRETRGDFEHRAMPPGLALRALIVVVLSVIEVFLLIWPVTNASWADVKSVAYVAGLVSLFLFMNEQLPKLAGHAVRDAREAVHAARELTAIGLTASRSGDLDAGRHITGHVDERLVHALERKRVVYCTIFGVVMTIYAAVMFVRVERLAKGLYWPMPFVLLTAALITAFTVGATVVMARWWSRGNALGDQLREHGMITDQSRSMAEDLAIESRAHAHAAIEAAQHANRALDLGEQALDNGVQVVGVGLQKAAAILGQESVTTPSPDNLFPAERPIRERAVSNIDTAKALLDEATQLLTGPGPFDPAGPAPNPWHIRTALRQAPPNPAFAEPLQIGRLHAPSSTTPLWRQRPALLWMAGLVTSCVLVMLAIVLAHG